VCGLSKKGKKGSPGNGYQARCTKQQTLLVGKKGTGSLPKEYQKDLEIDQRNKK
jgi:hypothetical protein